MTMLASFGALEIFLAFLLQETISDNLCNLRGRVHDTRL